jgi:NADH-quinone oxidoreductase subunit G
MRAAGLVVAHASVLTEGLAKHANVIFPAESHAEKEGTVVHPDGRLQRLRIAIQAPGEVRPGWRTLVALGEACGVDLGVARSEDAFAQLVASVAVYEGITLEQIGGVGVRWPERPAARALSIGTSGPVPGETWSAPMPAVSSGGHLALGTYRPLWAAPEVDISPALQYLVARQHVELSPDDAGRLGIADGDAVVVAQNGTRLPATALIHSGVPRGAAFLADGIASDSANALTEPLIEVLKP